MRLLQRCQIRKVKMTNDNNWKNSMAASSRNLREGSHTLIVPRSLGYMTYLLYWLGSSLQLQSGSLPEDGLTWKGFCEHCQACVVSRITDRKGFSYAQSRLIHISANELAKPAYDESGKTTVSILNKEFDGGFLIDSFSQYGFRLNNGITVVGSMVSFARTILSWKVEDPRHINEASLRLFTILEPKPDVVVIGVGDNLNLESKLHFNEGVHHQIMKLGRAMRLSLEIMPTQQAAGAYNFLISEGRHVAGAFIPPKHIVLTQNDIIRDKVVRETAVRPAIPGF